MKKLLIPIVALLATNVSAQTYFEDDFSGGFGAWTLTDADGDGNNWIVGDYATGDGHGNVANSASWSGSPLNPNNWMVAGPIDLSGAGGVILLEWVVKAQDPDWTDEEYSSYAGTSADVADLEASPYVFNEIIGGTDGAYVYRSLDISALAGEASVYIAFRHHNSTDQFKINIDDILVRTPLDHDIKMTELTMAPAVEASMVDITGSVKNNGTMDITSFEIDWNDGTAHTETFTETIVAGASFDFTHATQLNAIGGTTYDITVCANLAGDEDETNDCMNTLVSCVTEIPTKYVVGLEKTGTWCGWCPRGAVALEGMESEELFIGIAVHNGDPMTVDSYDGAIGTYVPGGYPGAGVDHFITGDPSDFATMYATRSSHVAPASITVSYAEVGTDIEVTVTANFVGSLAGDYRLAAVITEDHVTGTASGYNQANYYSDGEAGEMGGYEDLTDPVPAADMVYDHVARALGNDEILGTAGSLPATISAGDTESYTYTIPKGADWNIDYLHFVGMLIDASTGEILNAGKSSTNPSGIEEINAAFNLSVYPNPSSTTTNIEVSLIETANVKIEIYNAIGELVYTKNTENLTAGAYIYTVNVNAFSAGLYTVKTTVNNTSKTAKLSVR